MFGLKSRLVFLSTLNIKLHPTCHRQQSLANTNETCTQEMLFIAYKSFKGEKWMDQILVLSCLTTQSGIIFQRHEKEILVPHPHRHPTVVRPKPVCARTRHKGLVGHALWQWWRWFISKHLHPTVKHNAVLSIDRHYVSRTWRKHSQPLLCVTLQWVFWMTRIEIAEKALGKTTNCSTDRHSYIACFGPQPQGRS